jgi:hypothetical protein
MPGSAVGVANAIMLRVLARVMQGETDHGTALIQEGLANWRKTGSKFHVPYRLARAMEAPSASPLSRNPSPDLSRGMHAHSAMIAPEEAAETIHAAMSLIRERVRTGTPGG